MDKYEYRIRAEEINALIDKKKFAEAVKIADTIDWRRVKSVMMLCKISELYKVNRRYEDSKEILLLAYDRNPGSRKIVYSLCELAIKLEETVQAVEYYKEFVQIAPRDTGKFILQYRLYEAQDVSLEERIAVLEEYKKRDYREKWAYELAYLYHRIGLATRCVEECDELILWFGEGKYVIKAMELKMLHCPLTASQQEKYDRRFQTQEPVLEENMEPEAEQETDESALPIEIKAVEPSNAPTTRIPSKNIPETGTEEEGEEPGNDIPSQPEAEEPEAEQKETAEEQAEEEIPVTQPDDDLDIKVKTIDVDNEYSTINLQQELAKSLAKFMAEEDMVASDATMAMPFASLAEAATSDTIMEAITDDSIKNAIIAPLLQDTAELTPITEEDLLASMEKSEESKPQEEEIKESLQQAEEVQESIQQAEEVKSSPQQIEGIQESIRQEEEVKESPQQAEEVQESIRQAEEAKENWQQMEGSRENRLQEEEKKPSIEDILSAPTIQIPASVQKVPVSVPVRTPEEEPDEITEQFVKALEEEAVAIPFSGAATGQKKAETESIPVQPVSQIEKPIQGIPSEPVEPEQAPVPAGQIPVELEQAPVPTEQIPVQPEQAPVQQSIGQAGFMEVSAAEVRSDNSEQEEQPDDGQITGQLSLEDIMAEWEETKRANEERRMQEMRERVIQQTGPMFSNFDAMARASVQADLDLISPAEDVFNHEHLYEEPKQKETEQVVEEPVQEEITETEEKVLKKDERISSVTFDTAEIYGLEEKLLDALNSPEIREEPVPMEPIAIDSSFFEEEKEEAPISKPLKETASEPLISEPVPAAAVPEAPKAAPEYPVEVPVPEVPIAAMPEYPVEAPVSEAPTAAAPEYPVEAPVPEAPKAIAPEYPVETSVPEVPKAAAPKYPEETPVPEAPKAAAPEPEHPAEAPIPVAPVSAPALEVPIEIPIPDEEAPALDVSVGKPVDLKSTDVIETFVPKDEQPARSLTKAEKSRFAPFAPDKDEQGKVARALDIMDLSAATGNMLITGEHGTGTLQAAQNVVVQLKEKYPEFSGKMAKITGELLAEKNIGATLENLENSALLIEQAGDLPADALGNLLFHLERLKEHKVFVIMEDTKKDMERLTLLYPDIAVKFNARIDIQALDNDGLVNYAKEYAREQEYAIDDMGILALYTKISDMQTIDHAVTVAEVKEMVDKAIVHAEKKNMSHFMDIIFAKRYDREDMIILREKDFLN